MFYGYFPPLNFHSHPMRKALSQFTNKETEADIKSLAQDYTPGASVDPSSAR